MIKKKSCAVQRGIASQLTAGAYTILQNNYITVPVFLSIVFREKYEKFPTRQAVFFSGGAFFQKNRAKKTFLQEFLIFSFPRRRKESVITDVR